MDTQNLVKPFQKSNGRWYISYNPTTQSFRNYEDAQNEVIRLSCQARENSLIKQSWLIKK